MKTHTVIPERAGDGTLYEVADLTGRIVSAHPCARRAAVALAEHLDCETTTQIPQRHAMDRRGLRRAWLRAYHFAATGRIPRGTRQARCEGWAVSSCAGGVADR